MYLPKILLTTVKYFIQSLCADFQNTSQLHGRSKEPVLFYRVTYPTYSHHNSIIDFKGKLTMNIKIN